MQFNPEDGQITGPRCRNCHKGSSGCGSCHNTDPLKDGVNDDSANEDALVASNDRASITYLFAKMFQMVGWMNEATAHSFQSYTGVKTMTTSNGLVNTIASDITTFTASSSPVEISNQVKHSRTVPWSTNWRQDPSIQSATCSDDGISFPHRTLGWKMLKDDLFGLDFDGSAIAVGETRTYQGTQMTGPAHDIDSVCLDCHNPTVWNATSSLDHTDSVGNSADDMDDDVILRGLP